MHFVDDVTVPDHSIFYPGQTFVKTWRLKNIGTCTWTPDYELVFSSGDMMSGPTSQHLDQRVGPGETIDISVALTTPDSGGTHIGYWKLRNPAGGEFGWGSDQSKAIWANIEVSTLATVNPNTPLDMAEAYCNARWVNNEGGGLSCPAEGYNFLTGSISRTDSPKIEINYQDDELTLITIPNDGVGGSIAGYYPPVAVRPGDHFRALAGCLDSSPDCSVTFLLKYQEAGTPRGANPCQLE